METCIPEVCKGGYADSDKNTKRLVSQIGEDRFRVFLRIFRKFENSFQGERIQNISYIISYRILCCIPGGHAKF